MARWKLVLVAAVLPTLAALVTDRPASAATFKPGCSTASKTFYISQPPIAARVGAITMHVETCLNSAGAITGTTAWSSSSLTGFGLATMWEISFGPSYRTSFATSVAVWRVDGTARICIAHISLICSKAADFQMVGAYYSGYHAAWAKPLWVEQWSARCTNSNCNMIFNNAI
jgi:hypothetical protein